MTPQIAAGIGVFISGAGFLYSLVRGNYETAIWALSSALWAANAGSAS